MSASGILPTYQRFVNGVPVPFSRKSFRPREKYVILLVFITFGLVCFGTFFFLPEFKGSKSTADSVYKVYDKIKKAGPELLIPPPPHLEDEKDTLKVARHDNGDSHLDPHVIDDRAKLKAKIEQDEQLKVLERPDMGQINRESSTTAKSNMIKPLEETLVHELDGNSMIQDNSIITVPPANSNHYPVITGGAAKDIETKERRNKVKEIVIANKIVVRKIEPCDRNVRYSIDLSLNFTDHGSDQLADLFIGTPVQWDDNVGSFFELSYMFGNRWVRVFRSREKNLCKVLNMYFGEVWYNVARQINVEPKKCPIPKGRYELHGFDPKLNMFSTPIPNGLLKLLVKLIDNKTQGIMQCKTFISESTSE